MANVDILEQFANDDVYKLFLTEDFDVKVVTSSAVQLVAVSEHLAKLSAGITLLDKELHQQVSNHYEGLLSQATEIETLENVLYVVNTRIQTLLTSAERLLHNIIDPHETVSTQTVMLVRLQKTCDLLRRVIRIMQLSHRLEFQLNGSSGEIVKAAQSLNELDYLMEGMDFSGLRIISNNLQLIKSAREQVHNQANVLLLKGIEAQDRASVGTALQVFHSLQILVPVVQQILQQTKAKINKNVQQALDVTRLSSQSQDASLKIYAPGRAAMPLAGNTAAFRASLWANMEGLMNHILSASQRVQHLQNVLAKKRDPVSHMKFIDELKAHGICDVVQNLWEAITRMLTDEFSRAAAESTYIKQAFEVEFPKLLCMFNDFLRGLQDFGCNFMNKLYDTESDSTVNVNPDSDARNNNIAGRSPEKAVRDALAPFESAYLSRCLSRLTDSVNVVYAGEGQNVPTAEDVEGIAKAIKSELLAASIDALLLLKVAKNVSETILFFVEKCQYLVSTDKNATQVIDIPNSSQLVNAKVVHLLHLFQTRVAEVLAEINCVDEATTVIQNSLQSTVSLITIAVEPLLQSVSSAVESIIGTMHKEDFSVQTPDDNTKMPEAPCSLYMRELQKFVMRSQNDYFCLYPDCDAVVNGIQSLGCRTVELFVRHVSLVRPLGDGGKMKLATDFAQMEMAVSIWCQKIGDLGKVYRLLRSFRPLLFQTPNHIAQSQAIGDIIPYSLALHFLFARAPPELKSPHAVAGLSVDDYSQWLDQHSSEKERLVLIKASLEKYICWVKQRQDKEFCSVYPVIVDLLQKGLEAG